MSQPSNTFRPTLAVVGVDWGGTFGRDPMVAELALKDTALGWLNYDEYYSIRSGYRELRDVLLGWIQRYKVERVWCGADQSVGAMALQEILPDVGIAVTNVRGAGSV